MNNIQNFIEFTGKLSVFKTPSLKRDKKLTFKILFSNFNNKAAKIQRSFDRT